MVDPTQFVNFVVNGVVFGSILALGAIGLTLVYGILKLANFAHGDFLAFGAFMAFWAAVELLPLLGSGAALAAAILGIVLIADLAWLHRLRPGERVAAAVFMAALGAASAWIYADPSAGPTTTNVLVAAALLSMLATASMLVLLEYGVWRPLRNRGAKVVSLIIVSIGLSLIVRNALQIKFTGSLRSFRRPTPVSDVVLGIRISEAQQFTLLAVILVLAGVHLFLTRTRTGKAMRALSDNIDLARTCGIDVNRIVVYVWALGGILVAIAGVLLTLVQNNNMNVNMGFALLLPMFAAVILGGIGSAYGAIAGGLVVGIGMKTSALWLGTEYEAAAAFIILIVVLMVRPTGLFGVR